MTHTSVRIDESKGCAGPGRLDELLVNKKRVPEDDRPEDKKPASGTGLRRLLVSDLLAGEREVILDHHGQHYKLRITANGRLILTK